MVRVRTRLYATPRGAAEMIAPQFAILPTMDTLGFSITEEALLTNDTVRIVVNIDVLKQPEMTEQELRSEMKQAVRSFIDAPDWQLSQARREKQPSGYETVA